MRLTSSGVRLRGEVEVWVDVRLRGSQDLFKGGMNILQANLEKIQPGIRVIRGYNFQKD